MPFSQMEGYEVSKEPLDKTLDGSVQAFLASSKEHGNRTVTVIRNELTRKAFQAYLPAMLDEVINLSLELVRSEDSYLKILEVQLDFSKFPESYVVFYIMDSVQEERKEDAGKNTFKDL